MAICLGIVLLALTSCSAEWHIKRAIQKNPSILKDSYKIVYDTIVIRDSILGIDTFVMSEIDTIRIDREGIKTEIVRYRDRFIVKQEIKSDTIFRTKTIHVPQIEYVIKKESKYMKYLAIGGLVLGMWILVMLLGISIKKLIE